MRVDVVIDGFFGFPVKTMTVKLADYATVGDALGEVKRRTGLEVFRLPEGAASVLLSGRRLTFPLDSSVRLADGDLLAVLSPLAGG